MDRLEADARGAATEGDAPDRGLQVQAIHEEDPEAYLERVRRGKEYVAAGDIYQTNLSRSWRVDLENDPDIAALYNRLCTTNPAPFAALAQWRGTAVVSSSPERLVRVEGRRIDTRPIAGTRPRSRRPGDDLAEMTALVEHPKERAEHIMLIDLERNDLGRVCEAGTVKVDELMTIESYAHVHHIVSNVSGTLRADVTPIEALRAVFPGGTITGVPKFRCMQIIAELEGAGRGAYTGSPRLFESQRHHGSQHPDTHHDCHGAADRVQGRVRASWPIPSRKRGIPAETRAKAKACWRPSRPEECGQ